METARLYPVHRGTSALLKGYRPYPGEVLGMLPAADAMSVLFQIPSHLAPVMPPDMHVTQTAVKY